MNRQYVGARYVPVFADPIEWNDQKTYEPLTIVTYMGSSYTSRKRVPAGVRPTDNVYWAITGNYNAQVEQYRQVVESLREVVEGIPALIDSNTLANVKDFGAVGDGVTDDTNAFAQAITKATENKGGVFIPKGTFLVNGIMFNWRNHSGINFYGTGFQSVVKLSAPITFVDVPGGAGLYHMSFNDIRFTNNDNVMVNLDHASNIVFNRCWFFGGVTNDAMFYNAVSGWNNENKLVNCYFDSDGKDGLYMYCNQSPNSGDAEIIDCIFQGRGAVARCVCLSGCGSTTVTGCHIYGVKDSEDEFDIEVSGCSGCVAINNCYIDSYPNRGKLMVVRNMQGNLAITNCHSLVSEQCTGGIFFDGTSTNVIVSNYFFIGSKPITAGIYGDSSTTLVASCVVFPDNWDGAKIVGVTVKAPDYQ